MKSIFLQATQSGWYAEFLSPVVDAVLANPGHKEILDIGTGPGTLPQMLITKRPDLKITGIDINIAMIDEARKSVKHKNVSFEYQQTNKPLPFSTQQFDVVTFCSVLFLLDDNTKTFLINEAMRVLKTGGNIIVLTPSGQKSILSSFSEVWQYKSSFNNFTFPIWKTLTTHSARKWKSNTWLKKFSSESKLNYTASLAFQGNATIEIISNHK